MGVKLPDETNIQLGRELTLVASRIEQFGFGEIGVGVLNKLHGRRSENRSDDRFDTRLNDSSISRSQQAAESSCELTNSTHEPEREIRHV